MWPWVRSPRFRETVGHYTNGVVHRTDLAPTPSLSIPRVTKEKIRKKWTKYCIVLRVCGRKGCIALQPYALIPATVTEVALRRLNFSFSVSFARNNRLLAYHSTWSGTSVAPHIRETIWFCILFTVVYSDAIRTGLITQAMPWIECLGNEKKACLGYSGSGILRHLWFGFCVYRTYSSTMHNESGIFP